MQVALFNDAHLIANKILKFKKQMEAMVQLLMEKKQLIKMKLLKCLRQ